MKPINYDELDPGIRETVRWMRELGFETIDSGDGSKAGWMEGALDFPHVVARVRPRDMIDESHRLLAWCSVKESRHKVQVEATYDPADCSAILLLSLDATMPEGVK